MSKIVVHRRHGLRLAKAKRLAASTAAPTRGTKDGFEIRVEIGLLLTPLRSRIEREIDTFCDQHFGQAGSGGGDQPVRPAALRSGATRSSRSQGMSRSVWPK
jgi:hypothetical protein